MLQQGREIMFDKAGINVRPVVHSSIKRNFFELHDDPALGMLTLRQKAGRPFAR